VLDTDGRIISDEFARGSRACLDTHIFMATIGGVPAGCGTLQTAGGIGWVGGAATLPEFRRRGVQAALLGHRLRLADELGCDLVAATALPYGQSARNLVHLGFQHVQTQVVLEQKDDNNQV
jgi:GNAT superfamily N-acetyltransferase